MAMLDVARAGDRLVAVGEAGVVLFSDDHGKSWRQAQVPVSVSLTAVQFIDAKRGYATGHMGVVLRTEDGGEHWRRIFDGVRAAQLVLEQARARHAAATGDEVKAAERALGDAERLVADGPDKPFLGLHFADADNGFVFGAYNLIFRTGDGGATWTAWQDRLANPNGFHLYGMAHSGDALVLAGERGCCCAPPTRRDLRAARLPYKGSFFGITATAGGSLIATACAATPGAPTDGASTGPGSPRRGGGLSAGGRLADGRMVLASQGGAV